MSAIESIKRHVTYLSTQIGPRGSTTSAEKQAADYAAQVYRDLGMERQVEEFTSAKSAWWPFALGMGVILLAEGLVLSAGRAGAVAAAVLAVAALISLILELTFTHNPIRWLLPKGRSQNVSVCIEPVEQARQTLVLIGHLDTHRTPIVYASRRWFRVFSSMTTVTFACVVVLAAIFVTSQFANWPSLHWLSLIPALPVLALFLITFSADFTPYTQGANDNATGAAMMMALAERLRREPLRHTRVHAVNTGCEEVGLYGAQNWVNRHHSALQNVVYIATDNVGGKGCGPCYLTKETLIFPFLPDIGLLQLADDMARQHPEWGAYSAEQKAAYTEAAIGIRAGFRSIAFVGYTPDGIIPNWHQRSDVIENVDWEVLGRVEAFVWAFIQSLDRQAATQEKHPVGATPGAAGGGKSAR